jgi:hypothetical protein
VWVIWDRVRCRAWLLVSHAGKAVSSTSWTKCLGREGARRSRRSAHQVDGLAIDHDGVGLPLIGVLGVRLGVDRDSSCRRSEHVLVQAAINHALQRGKPDFQLLAPLFTHRMRAAVPISARRSFR